MSAIGNSNFSIRIQRIMGFNQRKPERSLPIFLFLLLAVGLVTTCWPLTSKANGNIKETSGVLQTITPALSNDTVAPQAAVSRNQSASKVNSAPQPTPVVVLVAEMSNQHVLYIGLDNPLRIIADGVPSNEIMVKLVGPGTIQGQSVDYKVQVTTPGEVNIAIYRRQKSQDTLLQTLTYQVKTIPNSPPFGTGSPSRKISVAEFVQHPVLSIQLDTVEFEVPYEIVSYEMTILPKEQDPITYTYHSPNFSENALEAIKNIQVGSTVFIDDIKIKCPGDVQPRNVGGMVLKIVE